MRPNQGLGGEAAPAGGEARGSPGTGGEEEA